MKNRVLFSSKDKSKKLKCHLLQFLSIYVHPQKTLLLGAARKKEVRTPKLNVLLFSGMEPW